MDPQNNTCPLNNLLLIKSTVARCPNFLPNNSKQAPQKMFVADKNKWA
jgi:hypothetical protein